MPYGTMRTGTAVLIAIALGASACGRKGSLAALSRDLPA